MSQLEDAVRVIGRPANSGKMPSKCAVNGLNMPQHLAPAGSRDTGSPDGKCHHNHHWPTCAHHCDQRNRFGWGCVVTETGMRRDHRDHRDHAMGFSYMG
jgi:hypothetical protein